MARRLEDLFPLGEDGARAILPHQRELIESTERYVYLQGGFGSGKSLAAAVLTVLLAAQVPGTVIPVCRRSYQKLHDSTLRILLEVLERGRFGAVKYQENFKGFPHRIVLPNASEIWARETKDLGRWLGPEIGAFWVDEAQEEPEKTFTGLVSRLRLPQARAFHRGILTSNPPPTTHWLAGTFGLVPGVTDKVGEQGRVTQYRLIRASTRQNPHLGQDYVDNLIATHGAAAARRIVDGDYGFEPVGTPVYANAFDHGTHVGEPQAKWVLPLTRAWDFGYRHPAVTWHQSYACPTGTLHWLILDETDVKEIEAEPLADKVLAQTKARFPQTAPELVVDVGDHAGAQVSDKGPGPIVRLRRPPWNLRFKYRRIVNIDPGLDLVRKLLRAPKCRCGFPVVLIHRRCRNVIEMFAGGYHYPERGLEPGSNRNAKPWKDLWYDDYGDSIRYYAENILRPKFQGTDRFDELVGRSRTPTDAIAPELLRFSPDRYLDGLGEEARSRVRIGGPIGGDDLDPATIARWNRQ